MGQLPVRFTQKAVLKCRASQKGYLHSIILTIYYGDYPSAPYLLCSHPEAPDGVGMTEHDGCSLNSNSDICLVTDMTCQQTLELHACPCLGLRSQAKMTLELKKSSKRGAKFVHSSKS